MMILRSVHKQDLKGIIELLQQSHFGLTTISKDPEHISRNIQHSLDSFEKRVIHPEDEYYLFVLEEVNQKKILGISAIFATTGGKEPLYFYKKEIEKKGPTTEDLIESQPLLNPVCYMKGPSELCSLFLHHDVRKKGIGKLLSYGRLLFVARYPERFTENFFAELRGVIKNEESPFWTAVGSHFLKATFAAVQERLRTGRNFIKSFLPKHPIYTNLLSDEAKQTISKTHTNTEAALQLLLRQGFTISDEIDIFDGGPKLVALKEKIDAVANSFSYTVQHIEEHLPEGTLYLISNDRLVDYKATIALCRVDGMQVTISQDVAEALQISIHTTVRLYEVNS